MESTYGFIGEESVGAYVGSRLEEAGFIRRDAVEEAEVIFTYCPHLGALEDAYFEDDGLIRKGAGASLVIDLSPSTPDFARELAAVATVNDFPLALAPLAIEDPFIPEAFGNRENMLCYCGGEEDDVAAARPLLDLLFATVHEVGSGGSAALAKALHTIHQAADVVSAVEGNVLYRLLHEKGLGAQAQSDDSGIFDESYRAASRLIASEDFSSSFTVAMLLCDVAAAMTAADDAGLILPQLESALHLLELIAVIGGADKGVTAISLLYLDEEESAAAGLDWSRAEGLYDEGSLVEGDADGEEDGFDFPGGFSEYYAN